MFIGGFLVNFVAGGPRQVIYATTILCIVGHFNNKLDLCICSRRTLKAERVCIVEKFVFGWNYSHYTPRPCFALFCSAPCCPLPMYITYFTFFIFG